MCKVRVALAGVMLAAGGGAPPIAAADVIYLTNGSEIQVDAWRDAGDAIEFTRSGGIIRIAKADIRRIDGKPTTGDFRMRSAPESLSGSAIRGASTREAALRGMADFLKEGEAIFAQAGLPSRSKADAFRRLTVKWRDIEVPEALRDAYMRGQDALQMSAEAYTVEDEGRVPNAKDRIEAAKKAVQEAQEVLKKAGEGSG